MARRNDHSRDELHAMAIKAAQSIIVKDGVDGISARKIAQHIGYTAGTLYQAFDSLNDIILHANALSLSQLYDTLNRASSTQEPARQRLLGIAEAYLHFAQQHHNQWAAIFQYRPPAQKTLPDWYASRIDALFLLVENNLEALSPKRAHPAIQTASRVLWSGVHGICILHTGNKLHVDGFANPLELVHSLIHYYLQSWATESLIE